jgi:hypothetical protein
MGALLSDAPAPVLAVATCPTLRPDRLVDAVDLTEVHLPLRRSLGRIESTRAARVFGALDLMSINRLAHRLSAVATDSRATSDGPGIAFHTVAHTLDFVATLRAATALEMPLFLSVHDDLSWAVRGRMERRYALGQLGAAWRGAHGRFVICDEMGAEMCRCYGERPYVVVTDGLDVVAPSPQRRSAGRIKVYFMGSAHLSFAANFQCLVEALAQLRDEGADASLVIRGDLPFPVSARNVPIETRPWAEDGFPARDLDDVDVAYLPLPFDRTQRNFVRFSMSTKMVTYLGSGVPLLFHGPRASAAGRLLSQNGAALFADSLDVRTVVEALRACDGQRPAVTESALRLARTQFALSDIRTRFWQPILEATERSSGGYAGRSRRPAHALHPEPQ